MVFKLLHEKKLVKKQIIYSCILIYSRELVCFSNISKLVWLWDFKERSEQLQNYYIYIYIYFSKDLILDIEP